MLYCFVALLWPELARVFFPRGGLPTFDAGVATQNVSRRRAQVAWLVKSDFAFAACV